MKKPAHILTDTDGCLANWGLGFSQFMLDKGCPQLPNTTGFYSISNKHGISVPEARAYIKEFNESSRIADLPPFADAQEYVGKLANLGFRFTVVSSLSSHPNAKIHRTANLRKLYGDVFDEIVCLDIGANKYAELTRWQDSDLFWIEDHTEQAEAGHRAGLRTVLITHPYNSEYRTELFPTVTYESPWKEIYIMICKDYGIDG